MADYKDYIVRYDIVADVTKATEGLQTIANIAKEFEAPMKALKDSITQVSRSMQQLKTNSQIKFEPIIDVRAFNNQLKGMVIQVRNAAAEMHTALFEALNGNAASTKAMRQGANAAFGGTKSVKDLKADIAAYNKELDKLLGTRKVTKLGKNVREKDGSILMAKNAGNLVRVTELESRKKALQNAIKQRKAQLIEAEKLEKELAAQQARTAGAVSKTVTPVKAEPAKLTNVTPAVIKEWKKAFGDSKNKLLTVNIRGNASGANGALTVIEKIQSSLKLLQEQAVFQINPILSKEGFAAAEAQLRQLAELSRAIAAPFGTQSKSTKVGKNITALTKEEQAKLTAAQQQVKAWNEKIASIQSRLNANKTKYAQAPTPALKGQITKDENLLAKYGKDKAEQEGIVKNLQAKAAKATTTAIAQKTKPLAIDVVGNLSKLNVTKEFIVPVVGEMTKIQNKISEAIPVNVKIMADQVAQSLRAIPRPTLIVDVKLNTSGVNQQIQSAGKQIQVKPAAAQQARTAAVSAKTKATAAKAQTLAQEVVVAPVVQTADIVKQIKAIPRQTIPVAIKLMWEKGVIGKQAQFKAIQEKLPPIMLDLNVTAAQAKLEEFIAQVKASSPQNIKLTATGTTGSKASTANMTIGGSNQTVVAGTGATGHQANKSQSQSKGSKVLTAQDRYDNVKALAAKKKLTEKQTISKWQETQTQQRNWYAQQQAMYNQLFGAMTPQYMENLNKQQKERLAQIQKAQDRYTRLATGRMSGEERVARMADAQSAFGKGLTSYEKQLEAQEKANAKLTSASHLRKANALRAQAQSAMIPFAQSKEQLSTLVKYRRFFKEARYDLWQRQGIWMTPSSSDSDKLKYLSNVSRKMQEASVAVPWQFQNQINSLQAQVGKANGVAPTSGRGRQTSSMYSTVTRPARQTPFYDQSRKWAYPFTGNTSFGARTPMAVDMAKGMGVMFAIGGAMSAVGDSFSQAVEYQNTMRTTNAILKNGTDTYTAGGFKNMEQTVRNVGVETKFTAPQVANAARFLAMAGYDINAINDAIRPIADLAIIGDNDLGEVADKMTNIMTTFGIKPKDMRGAANVMTTTMTRSNTDLMMLAESAKYGGGVANMYGKGDKNLFADTMALFGVMGNSGIQASSAGTALRMMYQNIFRPNKNQKKLLDQLNKNYGIATRTRDGGYRAMADILIDIANRVPQNQMGDVVGGLFRITAQPGANAAIMAAAQQDNTNAAEVSTGLDAISKFVDKNGVSTLVKLMQANRESVNGNISVDIADEKKNTVQGLWYQMTSTFTEGIVKSFEGREEYFAGKLAELRDYLAKPETIQMMQNLFDMIINIGEVMVKFVGLWAKLYNLMPGVIGLWIKWQMIFTQIGALMSPVVSLIGVFSRFGGAIAKFTSISTAATTAINAQTAVTRTMTGATAAAASATSITSMGIGASTLATKGAIVSPFVMGKTIGTGSLKGKQKIYADKAAKWENAIMGAMALHGLAGSDAKNTATRNYYASRDPRIATAMDNKRRYVAASAESARRYAEVQERAKRIYSSKNRFFNAVNSTAMAGTNILSFAAISKSLKSAWLGLITGFGKLLGILVNPITLIAGGLAVVGFSLYKFNKRLSGDTDGQKAELKRGKKAGEEAIKAEAARGQWYKDLMPNTPSIPTFSPTTVGSNSDVIQANERSQNEQKAFDKLYVDVFGKNNEEASEQSIQQNIKDWRSRINSNPASKLGFGNRYNELVGTGLAANTHKIPTIRYGYEGADLDLLNDLKNTHKYNAEELQRRQVQGMLMIEGANSQNAQNAIAQIIKLKEQVLSGNLSQNDFIVKANEIRDKAVNLNNPKLLGAEGKSASQLRIDPDRSRYRLFQEGTWNVINANIQGEIGTITGYIDGIKTLQGNVTSYSQQWWNAISRVIGQLPILYEATSNDGKQKEKVQLMLSMLPNGLVDYSGLISQIQSKIQNFNLNLQSFSDIMATAYRMMAEAGLVKGTYYSDFIKFARTQNQHQVITRQTAGDYWETNVKNNKAWNGIDKQTYVNWVTSSKRQNLNVNGKDTDNAVERVIMRRNIADVAGIAQKKLYDENKKKTAKLAGNGGGSTDKGNPNKPTTTPPAKTSGGTSDSANSTNSPNQNSYKSAYDRQSARPTQVVINVDKLANFDRTMIASSAEERDLMAAMENKITEAVYRIFAEAANSANHIMDRT